jgi:YD repeat-containing protein
VGALFVMTAARADNSDIDPQSEYSRLLKGYQTVQPQGETPFGEQISLYTGDLTFQQADVMLPGRGPTISLVRSLVSVQADTQLLRPHELGTWTLSIPRIETLTSLPPGDTQPTNPGQSWFVGRLPNGAKDYARCSNFNRPVYEGTLTGRDNYWYGIDLVTESGDRQQLLKRASGNTAKPSMTNAAGNQIAFPAVTRENWQVGCLNQTSNGEEGEGFFAVSPDGTKYWFDYLVGERVHTLAVYNPEPPGLMERQGRMLATMYVSRIEDRFGNGLTFNYGGDDKIDSIVADDGREVDISWRTDGNRLIDHITAQPGNSQPRTWSYSYSSITSESAVLTNVTLPDQTKWTFDLHGLGGATLYDPDWNKCSTRTLPNGTSSIVSTITHPSGLVGKFYVTPTWHARSYVPSSCVAADPLTGPEHEGFPPLFGTYSITKKEISGPGVPAKSWSYSYEPAQGSTTHDACAGSGTCASTKWINVVDPKGNRTSYVYSTRWGETEGKLQRTDYYQSGVSAALRSEILTHSASTDGPWPARLGSAMTSGQINRDKDETWTPVKLRKIDQQARSFNWQAMKFDAFARVLGTKRASSDDNGYAKTKYDYTEYTDITDLWVVGQVRRISVSSNGLSAGSPVIRETVIDPATGLPTSTKSFGLTTQAFTYYANGELHTVADGLAHAYTFSNYKLGVARKIDFPDTHFIAATVDDFGQLSSVTDPLGNTTGYKFDNMGRLETITPPSVWTGSTITFTKMAAEYGIPANHWCRTVAKGSARSITYYDAEWRPILTRDYDMNDVAGTLRVIAMDYDGTGRLKFKSYPMATTPTRGTSAWPASLKGTRTTYDALGRPIDVVQDTELANPSLTHYDYENYFQTRLTDPRLGITLTSYQTYDSPSTDSPLQIQLPEGITTTFDRDRYGKTLSMTRSGPYSGGTSLLTRSYVYDAYQRLCRITEPETGSSVLQYDAASNVDWLATGLNISGTDCGQSQVPTTARISRTYDVMNRVLRMDFPDGTDDIAYTYDAAGNVGSASSEGISSGQDIIWLYGPRNSLGLPTSETLNVDGFTYGLQYTYTAWGALETIEYPDGRIVDYAPDALGRSKQAGSYVTDVSYFPDGDLAYYRYGNGIEFVAEKTPAPCQAT